MVYNKWIIIYILCVVKNFCFWKYQRNFTYYFFLNYILLIQNCYFQKFGEKILPATSFLDKKS